MIQRTRKRLARARTEVAATVIVVAIVVAIVSAWGYYASPVERSGALRKIGTIAVYGAIASGAYALLAVGFTLIYGVTDVINMGYGALVMLGTYFFFLLGPFALQTEFGSFAPHLGIFPALILAVILVAIIGTIIYRLAIHPVVEDPLAPIVTTIGVAVIIQQLALLYFKADYRLIRFYEKIADMPPPIQILGTAVPYARFWAFIVSLVLFAGLWMFVTKTKIGRAMRAVAQDREVAMLMGVNTERIYMLTMALSSSLAALAGIFIQASLDGAVHPYVWTNPLIMSFAVVILGGLGSIKGGLLGAFVIGYSERAVTILVPQGGFLVSATYLGIMVLVLLLRPKGLFGKRIELE